jgi:hypothetical protein
MSIPAPREREVHGRYRAYGVELACDFPLPPTPPTTAVATLGPTIEVRRGTREEVREGWRRVFVLHEAALDDGGEVRVERDAAGEHLIRRGEHLFRLSPDMRRMICAPPAESDPAWESSLLDWAPYAAAVLAKTECIHAGAIQVGGRVVAIAAPSGGGKSTLVAALAARGARFFSDDVVALEHRRDSVLAHPGAPFTCISQDRRALAEGLGTIRAEVEGELWTEVEGAATEAAPLAAVVILDRRASAPASPRFRPARFTALRALSCGFPGAGGGEARRLALLADIAAQAEVLRLEADLSVPPEELAAATLERLGMEP